MSIIYDKNHAECVCKSNLENMNDGICHYILKANSSLICRKDRCKEPHNWTDGNCIGYLKCKKQEQDGKN